MSNKRHFGEEEEDNRNHKRICSSYPMNVSVQLTLNQLLNSRSNKEIQRIDTVFDQNSDKNCFNCLTKCKSIWISCNFCERNVCDDCSLKCFRCLLTFCRLCAVKSYQFSHQNNVGVCLSCDS